MAIKKVDEKKCIGCGTCVLSCPMDVLRLNENTGKAEVRYPEECVVCCICVADCPKNAIEMTPGKEAPWFSAGY